VCTQIKRNTVEGGNPKHVKTPREKTGTPKKGPKTPAPGALMENLNRNQKEAPPVHNCPSRITPLVVKPKESPKILSPSKPDVSSPSKPYSITR